MKGADRFGLCFSNNRSPAMIGKPGRSPSAPDIISFTGCMCSKFLGHPPDHSDNTSSSASHLNIEDEPDHWLFKKATPLLLRIWWMISNHLMTVL